MYRTRWFLACLLFVVSPLFCDDDAAKVDTPAEVTPGVVPSLVNLTSLPSAVVNGSVNVITGDYCESDEEDVIFAPDPYVLGHSYFSSSLEEGNLGDGWNFFHNHRIVVVQPNGISYTKAFPEAIPHLLPKEAMNSLFAKGFGNRDMVGHNRDGNQRNTRDENQVTKYKPEPVFLSLYDPSGGRLVYKTKYDKKHKDTSMRHFKLESKLTGYTNIVNGQMSGQTNLKSTKLRWDRSHDSFHVTMGDGSKRTYERSWETKDKKKKDEDYVESTRDYHLKREIKPNGNTVLYDYNDKDEITNIRSWNKDFTQKLYSVDFHQRTTGDFAKNPNLNVTTSDGMQHTYYYKKLKGSYMKGTWSVSHIRRQGKPFTNFIYSEKSPRHDRRVIKKETEGGFYTATKYYRAASNWMDSKSVTPKDKKETKFLRNRVRMQLAPMGPDGKEIITHRYFYYKDKNSGGHCTVRDAYNNISRHYWNKDKRLIRVTKNDANDKRLYSERYYWGENDTRDEGRLMSRVLQDENYKPILCHTFSYDKHGNVLEDTLYGRITENSGTLRMEKGKVRHESCDKQVTRYTYSNDGFNLVTSMCDPLGNYTYYQYAPNSNLLTAKFTCMGKEIKKREFTEYDSCGIAIQKIIDDGTSRDVKNFKDATERHITRIKPRYSQPHFGEAEEVLEFFYNFDEKKEAFLRKTVNHFNDKGFVAKRELVDQLGGIQIYEYEYDELGRVTMSKDPLGNTERTVYDLAGRVIKKSGPRKDVSLHYEYNIAGQLISETEKHKSGLELTKRYEYDLVGRKVATTDAQNNTIRYEYDALNRITSVTYPEIFDHQGRATTPKKTYTYENLGAKVTEIDEVGRKTITIYNALGKVCETIRPDKTKTTISYDILCQPIKEVATNGAIKRMEYDGFGRMTMSRMMMDDVLICQNETIYNTFHPVTEIGPTGEKTTIHYDFAGRKKAIEQQDTRSKKYVYNAQGNILRERTYLDDTRFVGKSYKYDALNRVIQETNRDEKTRKSTIKTFKYDAEGNISHTTQKIGTKTATHKAKFLPGGLPLSQTDAKGHTTHHHYNYFYQNEHGQQVFCKTTINAQGSKAEEIHDARGNLASTTMYDPEGKLLAKKELFYDASNTCIRTQEYAVVDGIETKCITTLFGYKNGQLRSITEAAGTPEQKITRFVYNDFGQKKSATFSDGTILRYRYDNKGRVKRFFAADKSLDYNFSYDASDRVLAVTNALTGKQTLRQYNSFGELESEVLENGLRVGYDYDNAGRVISQEMPDNSKVRYDYSCFLEKITRIDRYGQERYSHTIADRDQSGLIKSAELANGQKLHITHDKLGRLKTLNHEHLSLTAQKYDALGNLLELQTQDSDGPYTRKFSYDFLCQLTQEQGHVDHTYSYDSLNNRLSHNDEPYSINSLHAVLSDNNRTFNYDPRGNRTSMQEGLTQTTYKYDALDRLIEVSKGQNRYVYSYDGFNRRTQKECYKTGPLGWIKENTTCYIYSQDNEIGSTDSNHTIQELRILGEGRGAEIGAAIAIELGTKCYIPIHDIQGSVSTLVDFNGQVVEHYRYDAFGNETTSTNAPINPWRFSSKRVDPETGMINFGRRYYDPTLGKWLTQDPLGLKAGPNLYAYCLNNPMSRLDPYGLLDETNGDRGFW
ncbi:MAG: hypothetical protein LLF94_03690, partial [Chlamydiales bacterium]|nr:hypothetical protein [Chlamydiales bacterium]